MKRFVRVASLCCLLAAGCFGQRMGYGGFRGGGFRGGGYGRVSGGFVGGPGFGFGHGFGGFRGGVFIGTKPFFHHPFYHRPFYPFYRSRFFYPGAYPAFYGGFGYGGGGYGGGFYDPPYYPPPYYGSGAAPNVTVIYVPPTSYGPEMISSRRPEPEYRGEAPPAAARAPAVYFQIAMKSGSVYAALAYWIEDGRLHYVDMDGARHELAVGDVDRARSEKLNKSRQVEFRLPPAQ